MKKMLALVAIAVLAFSGIAMAAPIDPDPDGMGVYFDTEGTNLCLTVDDWIPGAGAGPGTIEFYLLLTNPSTDLVTVKAWEARIMITENSILAPEGWSLSHGANYDSSGDPANFAVGAGADPIPIVGGVALLASNSLEWYGFEGTASMAVEIMGLPGSVAFPDSPGYSPEAGFAYPCQSPVGAWGPVCWIGNTPCDVVANEDMTWSAVKALY